jgi:hypothetical protein
VRTGSALDAEIESELRCRVAALKPRSYSELLERPGAHTEAAVILGRPVKFTTFREFRPGGRLLILVRSDRPVFLGFESAGTTEGFWVEPSGAKKEALFEEIAEYYA